MRSLLAVPASIALLLALNVAAACADDKKAADEPKAASSQEQMEELVKLGPGVHKVKKDDKGRVQSMIVVGKSRLSTALGATKGKEVAQRRAEQSAKAAFVQWLGEAVVVCENAQNEATVFMQGEESKDKDVLSEAGKAVEKNSEKYKSIATGLVRGLTMLHSEVNAEDKEYSIVYGWSLANSKSAKDTATHDSGLNDSAAQENTQKDGKKIRSEKTTSPEASDFLK